MLYDGQPYSNQIALMEKTFVKALVGRDPDFFDFHIFWRNQLVHVDAFIQRDIEFDNVDVISNSPFVTAELAIKTYLLQCGATTIEQSLLIVHDTEENSKGLLTLLDQAKVIGNVVYLPVDLDAVVESVDVVDSGSDDSYADNYADNYNDPAPVDAVSSNNDDSYYDFQKRKRRYADGVQV